MTPEPERHTLVEWIRIDESSKLFDFWDPWSTDFIERTTIRCTYPITIHVII